MPDLTLRAVLAFTAAIAIFVAVGLVVIVVDRRDTAAAQAVCRLHGEVALTPSGDWRCVTVVEGK